MWALAGVVLSVFIALAGCTEPSSSTKDLFRAPAISNVVDGVVVNEHTHEHQELEDYDQVLGWICEVHQALAETYPPPEHQTALARAASVQQVMACYPRLQGMVAPDR